MIVFKFYETHYGVLADSDPFSKFKDSTVEIIGCFNIYGKADFQENFEENQTAYALILEDVIGYNQIVVGITSTYKELIDNMGSIVLSYFDSNQSELMKPKWKKDFVGKVLYVDAKAIIDMTDQQNHDKIIENRQFIEQKISQTFKSSDETINLTTSAGEYKDNTYYVAEYGHSILRFTFVSSLDGLFTTKDVSSVDIDDIFKTLPKPVLLQCIIMSLSVEEFTNLSSISSYLNSFCKENSEKIWKHFLQRDFTITSLEDRLGIYSTYKEAYQYYYNISVLNIYEYPLIISKDWSDIRSAILGVPGYNNHGFFLKGDDKKKEDDKKKYKSAQIMLHTNSGYYYSIHCKHLDLTEWNNRLVDDDGDELEDLEEMVDFLLSEEYSGVVGAVLNGKIKYIYEMSNEEYRSIKTYIEHINCKNKRWLKTELRHKYF